MGVNVVRKQRNIWHSENESDAKTHHTPKARCANGFGSAGYFAKLLGVRTRRRVALALHHRCPARLDNVIFSISVSVGRDKANETASATCAALIIRSCGH